MASHSRDGGVNPLRPYYIPPSIGAPAGDHPHHHHHHHQAATPSPSPKPLSHHGGSNATGAHYASKARDMFADIDYKEYVSEPSPSAVRALKELLDESLWKYMSVLMAQPFEVSRTILQVRSQYGVEPPPIELPETKRPTVPSLPNEWAADTDSENEETNYFTSNIPDTPTPSQRGGSYRQKASPTLDPQDAAARTPAAQGNTAGPGQLQINKPDSVLEVLAQLWQKEGTWGIWKASNATFVYSALQSLLENWSRSLLCALFNVPDLGVKDDVTRLVDIASPYPWASFFIAAGAAVATGLILAPLDLVRTRLILTSVSRQPRRSVEMVRNLPSYFCPPVLMIPTMLHSLVHPVLTLSTPVMLRARFGIDRESSPTSFSLSKFCSSNVALFVKLPLETVLRRGQASVLAEAEHVHALDSGATALDTIIPCGRYEGVLGTMRHIVSSEGTRVVTPPAPRAAAPAKGKSSKKGKAKATTAPEPVVIRGQGMEGLWRGWKVSWWGLVGLWTAGIVGGGGDGEF
ncbi:hypothetical protein RB594_005597 [Gaeumannomyces avenae]